MRRAIRTVLSALALAGALLTPALAQDPLKITIGAMANGTVFWELEAMKALGLDKANNVELDVRELADAKAGQIALQAGEVDVILSDFVYVSIQRNSGNMLTFVPHSLAVGGLIVDPAANIAKVEDLKGKTLAISGSPVDKSWAILQAYYGSVTGGNLADEATVRFGAPPLINELITTGQAQASLNLWNWNARAKLAGKTELMSVWDMLKALGVSEQPPLLGWAFTDQTAETKTDALVAFLNASFATKDALRSDDGVWETIRPVMKVGDDDALFTQLRDDYRVGIVRSYDPDHIEAAEQSFALMAEHGGPDVVGDVQTLAPGTFWKGYSK
ncbi:MAG: ABC transporter substrate-binding protein [Devosia sp.]|uniref:ABC transporter substrate-binding protein n=1 Tax=Devosia sp. 66-22 TaxID=1895753 RepID=UPI00092CA866|nr:ABC transporter substrate-binding protein [Devosia sp. 66-22]MBN9346073.1 ABC transporter substrate-binding protein [Devosia sp.]OJX51404.1 MAG: sulfonate ABC transporter substrate-binding protein [Devosia sp. 66-22]